MIPFILKDLKIMMRDRTELIVLLLMPFILIGILGFALRGIFEGDTAALHMDVAILQEDHEEEGIALFIEELENKSLPFESIASLTDVARETSPTQLLYTMLEEGDLSEMVNVKDVTNIDEAKELIQREEIVAALTIPDGFTFDSLQKMLLDEGEGSELRILMNESGSLHANIFHDIIQQFVKELNFEYAIAMASGSEGTNLSEVEEVSLGGIDTISTREPVSSLQYYALGIAVMFILYVSSTLASKAFVEKKQHVFHRILLSGTHPMTYLSGKFVSGTLISFLQLVILFLLSTFVFQAFNPVSVNFWLGIAGISAILSLCVGGLSMLLTSISVRYDSDAVSAIFSGGVVSLFAFVGGSFFPTENMPEFFTFLGSWTPNGAGLTAYLQWLQGYEGTTVIRSLVRILMITSGVVLLSIVIFPKRRSKPS
ncbi:multidrug ABC transporter permease [Salipaludibacillus keqinensis]|uniref:Multidrug ABC transporter permease n=1 Tax=Salipaludibacillus keqinensis TaxID=2045207 RepID=A0A323TK94_9BACI|nr:ABC transporter permease [Salipaludibacillus keqinensis]PYZ95000.1 multidrug ABC transporter permease [Salipaludibacillus keqinensis]